jgi:hypothetical protein
MGRRYFCQQSTAVSGHARSDNRYPFAFADKPGFCENLPAALIAEQICI